MRTQSFYASTIVLPEMRRRILAISLIVLLLVLLLTLPAHGRQGIASAGVNSCGSCHSGFKGYSIVIDAPTEVPAGQEFEYNVVVKNTGQHVVKDLVAQPILHGAPGITIAGEAKQPYSAELSGSASLLSSGSHSFPVEANATQAVISLSGDDGPLNSLSMTITGPAGGSWPSGGSGVEQSITLTAEDLATGGVGEYSITVEREGGMPSISYSISVDVQYGMGEGGEMRGPELGPGDSYTFTWTFQAGRESGANEVQVKVSSTIYYDHTDPSIEDEAGYSDTASSEVLIGTGFAFGTTGSGSGTGALSVVGRVTGMLTLLFLALSIVVIVMQGNAKRKQRVHCWMGYAVLPLTIIHIVVLYVGPFRGIWSGLWSGIIDTLAVTALAYTGYKKKELADKWGYDKWKRYHLYLAILALMINIAHAVVNGTDFAFLR